MRAYRSADCPVLAQLSYDTVHSVNVRDCTMAPLDVWATGQVDLAAWDRSFREHDTVVAVEDGCIVGVADMDTVGYLDRLHVHKDHQGEGMPPRSAINRKVYIARRLPHSLPLTHVPSLKREVIACCKSSKWSAARSD